MLITSFTSDRSPDQTSASSVTYELAKSLTTTDPANCQITKYAFHKAVDPGGQVITTLSWLSVDLTTGLVRMIGYAGASIGTWSIYFKASSEAISFAAFDSQVILKV